ncbi:MAG: 4-hydroxythreonine-4-phosphate dehydrogenase PdxA [Verrucomicrobiae bacterium]|nr:4-hydroxythreonine-4-phosphate dehydrogenase PdxA [Verrucomicrobiae bacterium]
MGDPAGVGPEVCLMLLQEVKSLPSVNLIIYGDHTILERVASATGLPLPSRSMVRHIPSLPDAGAVAPGEVSSDCGKAAYDFLITAIDAALANEIDGLVTAPLNKEALRAAGIHFPGHTEILSARTKSDRTCMLQYSREVTATFVTCHCGYAEVPRLLTRERLREVIDLTNEAIGRIKKRPPKLVVLGLNPHAGEHGLFGASEEELIILPEVEAAKARGIDICGPIPPDTAFIPGLRQSTDAFVCMYHDQGHIPLKALAFDSAVNVTLGLPIVRTSVDHGTAFNIAWTGAANPGSILAATRLAVDLCCDTPGHSPVCFV